MKEEETQTPRMNLETIPKQEISKSLQKTGQEVELHDNMDEENKASENDIVGATEETLSLPRRKWEEMTRNIKMLITNHKELHEEIKNLKTLMSHDRRQSAKQFELSEADQIQELRLQRTSRIVAQKIQRPIGIDIPRSASQTPVSGNRHIAEYSTP